MSEIDELIKDIDNLKENLNELIERKNFNLQDPEIIKASQELNKVITKYNNLITKKLWQGLEPSTDWIGFCLSVVFWCFLYRWCPNIYITISY